MSKRFSYVRYDIASAQKQEDFKKLYEDVEAFAEKYLPEGRHKALMLTALEESFMWVGKAIRDEQIERNSQTEHVPERG